MNGIAGKTQAYLNRVLIVGLGSIGRRHLRHFRELGVSRIDAFRTGRATVPDEGQPTPDRVFYSLGDALNQSPQAVVVANPTALHLSTATAAVRAGAHVLLEKPLSHKVTGCEEFLAEAESKDRVIAVGCNLRFHPLLVALRDLITSEELGQPLVARAHFGAYLPHWHPWEDYHQSYAARRELGGGATLTHIHEIDYLLWLFGPAIEVAGFCLNVHPLGTDVDEASVGIIRHQGGTISNLSLSLCQKPPSRQLHVAFEGGNAYLDLIQNILTVQEAAGNVRHMDAPKDFSMDQTYAEQARAFAVKIAGEQVDNLCTGTEALADLRVALDILEVVNE